ncbi:reprolysin-like metallopeptidase [Chryseobacterium fistulae]|uniref:Fibronectin type-III domain-containing protein n=1 Tax=Chryseobacterium fistulae TaxID=2675058 RepID=A0A6N4XVP3_9FLAO|nr:zinc-dependent metalloprotease family protein [Chryseobacterium fistulae]CAA7391832.1 hypothetical protein CHRY9393_02994 [Chryseobacterium fistulae]
MKKIITILLSGLMVGNLFSQWTPVTLEKKFEKTSLIKYHYKLDLQGIREKLSRAEEPGSNAKAVEISLPTGGKIEKFAVYSFPVVVKELSEQYQLGSYVGVGIDDPTKYLRFSVSPIDFQSMVIKNGIYEFIDPQNGDKTIYGLHSKTKPTGGKNFICSTKEGNAATQQIDNMFKHGKSFVNQTNDFAKMSDKKYRTMRLAISTTGEYTTFHGGTIAGALSAINATMTRVNGVFEKEFALHLNVQNFPNIIYTNSANDPYTNNLNIQLQQTLTANVGEGNYDIGHLFNAAGNNGNAGCIGCVCIDPTSAEPRGKGAAFTQSVSPVGDNFDIDFVAHEMGHQLGANHTFSFGLEGAGVGVEPGSGSTIMGYAGITGSNTDVQPHSDPYFHFVSIGQVQANLIDKTCDVETSIANNPPVIAPLSTYNIPKGTAFVLTASATHEGNAPLTYTWEQVDDASVTINKNNVGNTSTGATFRSAAPTSSPIRYFPKLSSVMNGVLDNSNNTWESVSKVPRTTKFGVTVRDNNPDPEQQQTQSAEQTIIVGNDGPFQINTHYGASNGPSLIEWDVANTNTAPYNVANVKIDYTTDEGANWITLAASTSNDGVEEFIFPASLDGQTIKVRVSSIDNIFYAVKPIGIISYMSCDGTAPTGLATNNITSNSANISWVPIAGANSYVVRYKKVSDVIWQEVTSTTSYLTLSNLMDNTLYEAQVGAVCSNTTGSFSNSINFTTKVLTYCILTSGTPVDEYISNVTVANINNTSGPSAYTNYGTDPLKLVNLTQGSSYTISVSKGWSGTPFEDGVAAWIDFNRNGIFEANEKVLSSNPNKITPVSAIFTVPSSAVANQELKMRVALGYNMVPEACEPFQYGEVEDYNVIISSVLGTGEVKDSKIAISLYPNPVSDILNITNVSDKANYKIYGTTGQLVNQGNVMNKQVNVSGLIKGGYVIEIEEKGKDSFKSKFIKK